MNMSTNELALYTYGPTAVEPPVYYVYDPNGTIVARLLEEDVAKHLVDYYNQRIAESIPLNINVDSTTDITYYFVVKGITFYAKVRVTDRGCSLNMTGRTTDYDQSCLVVTNDNPDEMCWYMGSEAVPCYFVYKNSTDTIKWIQQALKLHPWLNDVKRPLELQVNSQVLEALAPHSEAVDNAS